jgi:hypothetical protein
MRAIACTHTYQVVEVLHTKPHSASLYPYVPG